MDKEQQRNNDWSERLTDRELKKCRHLLKTQLAKLWLFETEFVRYLRDCLHKTAVESMTSLMEQLLLESDQQVKRLGKICDAIGVNILLSETGCQQEVSRLMFSPRAVLGEFAAEEFTSHWALLLELEVLIHYKIACYQSMVSWSKYLRLDGVQELLEDSLDEYVHQDLMINLLTESWDI